MHETLVIDSPVGRLKISVEHNCLSHIELDSKAPLCSPSTRMGKRIQNQLADYFRSAGNSFQIPLLPKGTEFQTKVWLALVDIPPGEVLTYGELAKKLDSSARAVGNACRRNPTPIVVPCHRVVAKNGLGGFAGDTEGKLTDIKSKLLLHEGISSEYFKKNLRAKVKQ